MDEDSRWQDVFDTFTSSEQSCIRAATDSEQFDRLLDRPVLTRDEELAFDTEVATGEWAISGAGFGGSGRVGWWFGVGVWLVVVLVSGGCGGSSGPQDAPAGGGTVVGSGEGGVATTVVDVGAEPGDDLPDEGGVSSTTTVGVGSEAGLAPEGGDRFGSVSGGVWSDVFARFDEDERACVRDVLGEELWAEVSDMPVMSDSADEWAGLMLGCLGDETADELVLSVMLADLEEDGFSVGEADEACLRKVLSEAGVGSLAAAAMADPESESEFAEADLLLEGMMGCLLGILGDAIAEGSEPVDGPPPDSVLWETITDPEESVFVARVVADGVIYAATHAGSVYALDASTGALLWEWSTTGDLNPPPIVGDGVIHITDLDTHYALDASSGELLWSRLLWSDYGVVVVSVTGPAAYQITETADGLEVAGLEQRTGNQMWVTSILAPPEAGWFGPGWSFDVTAAENRIYVWGYSLWSLESQIHALDPTGTLVWTVEAEGDETLAAPPAVSDGVVLLRSDTRAYALDASTGNELWTHESDSVGYFDDFPLVVADGIWYQGNGSTLSATNVATGQRLWASAPSGEESDLGDVVVEPLTAGDGMLFTTTVFVYEPLKNALHALDTTTGDVVWSAASRDEAGSPHTMFADGVLYLHDVWGTLHALDARTGESIWSIDATFIGGPDRIYAITDQAVYMGYYSDDGSFGVRAVAIPTRPQPR